MVGGVSVGNDAVVLVVGFVRQRGREAQTEAYGPVASDTNHHHLVGVTAEVFCAVALFAYPIAVAGRGIADIKPSFVLLDIIGRMVVLDVKCSQRLIVFAVMPLQLALQTLGSGVVLLHQGFAYATQGDGVGHGVEDAMVGLAGPEGDVVQGNLVDVGSAVHHSSQPSVADGQGFLEVLRRLKVMQLLRHGRCRER